MTSSRRPPVLSICIVNWNTSGLLRECLESLYVDEAAATWEVLVVDNGSIDDSVDMVKSSFPQTDLITSAENLGFSGGSNLALEKATGDYLLLLNTDTRVEPGALSKMVEHMAANTQIGALGPRLVDGDGRLELSCGRRPNLTSEIVHKLLLHKAFPFFRFGRWHHRSTRCVGWVTGACLMVRREAAEQTGFLDQRFFMCFEDLDWCMRIQRQGWQIVYYPHCQVIHYGGQSIGRNLGEMLVVSQKSLYYLFYKHFGSGSVALLRVLTVVEMVLRSALWSATFILMPKSRSEGRVRLRAYRHILSKTLFEFSYWGPATSSESS